jgi:hypothetical protein
MVVFVIPATQEAEMGGSLGLKLETNLAAHSDPTLKNKKEGRTGRERERERELGLWHLACYLELPD